MSPVAKRPGRARSSWPCRASPTPHTTFSPPLLQPSWKTKQKNSHATTSRARPECAAIWDNNNKNTTPQIGCDEEAFVSRRATTLSALNIIQIEIRILLLPNKKKKKDEVPRRFRLLGVSSAPIQGRPSAEPPPHNPPRHTIWLDDGTITLHCVLFSSLLPVIRRRWKKWPPFCCPLPQLLYITIYYYYYYTHTYILSPPLWITSLPTPPRRKITD
jgi:hypothetical protein